MKYNGWTNWDTWATMLVLENSQPSYKWLLEWNKNFKKKIKRGVFSMPKAELVVKKYLVPVARGTRKPIFYDPYKEFVPEPDIDINKVNKKEIVKAILELDQ